MVKSLFNEKYKGKKVTFIILENFEEISLLEAVSLKKKIKLEMYILQKTTDENP